VTIQCAVFEVSRSGYYAWKQRPARAQQQRQQELLEKIQESRQTYGSPRVHAELQAQGEHCNVKTVARRMRENELWAKTKKKYKATTNSRHSRPVADHVLNRQFEPAAANEAWLSDITYIPTREGWLYVAAVEDLYSRQIVGWAMSATMTSDLVTEALRMALERRHPAAGLLLHSDRGSQYASEQVQKLLRHKGSRCSMSRKGNCWDNAPMESFFGTLKKELVHDEDYQSREEARQSIFEYIEVFYKRKRRHSALGYQTPVE
jgi:transposase InsO family protein